MATLLARMRYFVGAFALLIAVAVAAPVGAQINPTAQSVREEQMFQQLQQLDGRISIPDTRASVLIQPAGRDWRYFHNVTLRWIGGIAIVGVLALLVIYYLVRGTIKISRGRSGRTMTRFSGFERFMHWLTAGSFVVLTITGLNITFGKLLLLPLMSAEAFTAWSQWAKYAHNYLSFAFVIGLVFIFFMWLKDNIPSALDMEWLRQGGGLVGRAHPLARRFNAGQKIVYWIVVLGGIAMAISGYLLMFPFYGNFTISGMQTTQVVHGVVGVLLVAAMLGHIYIGTLGMEGAFEAMGTGEVDVNWAEEHHKLWVEEERKAMPASGRPAAARG